MKLQAATQETQMEKTLLYPQLQREQKPSEVLPLCIAAQDREAFLPRNAPFAKTLGLCLEESTADLYWLYAYNAALLISDQYIREAWKQ